MLLESPTSIASKLPKNKSDDVLELLVETGRIGHKRSLCIKPFTYRGQDDGEIVASERQKD